MTWTIVVPALYSSLIYLLGNVKNLTLIWKLAALLDDCFNCIWQNMAGCRVLSNSMEVFSESTGNVAQHENLTARDICPCVDLAFRFIFPNKVGELLLQIS